MPLQITYMRYARQQCELTDFQISKLKRLSASMLCRILEERHQLEAVKRTTPKSEILKILKQARYFPSDLEISEK